VQQGVYFWIIKILPRKEANRRWGGGKMKQSRREAIKAERNYRMKTDSGGKGWIKTLRKGRSQRKGKDKKDASM
jgi:hypothetical protein